MKHDIASILASLDQAKNDRELDRAIDAVLSSITKTNSIKTVAFDIPDDAETGFMSNKRPEKMVPVAKLKGVLIELMIIHGQYKDLQNHFNKLQDYVDKDYMNTLNSVTTDITSYTAALQAEKTYSSDWFSSLPLSISVKQEIAQSLIDVCAPYNVVNAFWQQLVISNPDAVDFASYNPRTK